ncbi:MAG: hypothetical protein AAB116_03435, partial [Candidatus Poribacteria bacterium]
SSIGPGGGGFLTAIAIDPTNENIVYVGTDLAGIFKSTDGGQNFKFICKGLKNLVIQKIVIDPRNTNILYLGTEGGLYKSTDGGGNWVKKINGFIESGSSLSYPIKAIAIDPNNSNIIYAGFGNALGNDSVHYSWGYDKYSQGQIYKSTNGGETWKLIINTGIETPAYIFEIAISSANSNNIFITTEKGFYKSNNGGISWVRKTVCLDRMTGIPFNDVRGLALHPTDPNILYVTVWSPQTPWNGGVFKSIDAGETWVAKNQGLLHRNDGSGGLLSNYPDVVIDSKNPDIIYTGDSCWGAYSVHKSTNGGTTWTDIIIYSGGAYQNIKIGPYGNSSVEVLAIANSNPNIVYFGTSMCVYKTANAGSNWIAVYTKEITPDVWQTSGIENTCLLDIAVDPTNSNTAYFGYADIGLLKSVDGGISFKTLRQGMDKYYADITSIVFDPDNSSILYAAGHPDNSFSEAVVMKSVDAGNTWSIIGNGASGLSLTGAIWAPIVIDPQSPRGTRKLYVAKYGSGIYKSTNGGRSWQAINNGLPVNRNIRALVIDPKNVNILYAGIYQNGQNGVADYGGVYKTIDGGGNWLQMDSNQMIDIWGLAVSPQNSSIVYAAVSSHWDAVNHRAYRGGVFRSTDAGKTWKQILDSNWIRTIAINPLNPSIIYAATFDNPYHDDYMSAGIHRSIDGGDHWALVNNNLPNTNVYKITIDHSDPRIIYIGTGGSGGFKGIDSSITDGVSLTPANPKIAPDGQKTQLLPAFPNPANPDVWIPYQLSSASE